MPRKQAMFKHALANLKTAQIGNVPGRAVGRNPTPGIPRRVGPGDNRFHPASSASKQPLRGDPTRVGNMRMPGETPGIAIGERPPGAPLPDGNPSGNPDPRPGPTLGMRRLDMLRDKNPGNDKRGLEVLMRLFGRAQADKGFGGKVFRGNVNTGEGSSLDNFFGATDAYTKGTGYRRMLRQAAGLPVRPRPKPRPMNYPGKPYMPRDNM